MILEKIKETINWNGKELSIETGEMARQADGAVLVSFGKTTLLCTCVYDKEENEETGFFPLTVNYQERFYASGRLPGGFVKREGKPSDHETLIARLIDRPIRPLFPDGFCNEVQVVCTLLSYDPQCSPEIAAMIGASAAISISGVPFDGPIAGCKVGYSNGKYILNPVENTDINLVVAGSKDGILMVESEINELPEDIVLNAVIFGFKTIQPIIDLINKLKSKINKKSIKVTPLKKQYLELYDKIQELTLNKIKKALNIIPKLERQNEIKLIKKSLIEELGDEQKPIIESLFEELLSNTMRQKIIKTKKRIDGRSFNQIRDINCKIDVLPQVHGSALFTRGETQALVVTTLGTSYDVQIVDTVAGESKESFLLHYNFPPFAVCEVGRIGAPGRREIGHGKLACRAISAVLPNNNDFPYTIRVVSEITESNGSSSMATVCGTSLSLMASGVPIKAPVAGIAMGLIKTKSSYIILSDIMGDEDHLGDMDFKVAGTSKGITALQMDIKVNSITQEIIQTALEQAREGRLHILNIMNNTISNSRKDISVNAPRLASIQIDKDKIRDLIGPGGKVIKDIIDRLKVKIEIEDSGIVNICAIDKKLMDLAINEIKMICSNPEIGQIFNGIVSRVTDFGAFISIGVKEGLLNWSRFPRNMERPKVGQKINVKIIDVDDKNRIKLSTYNED
ncbi:MAG: polyribonucleotide nucleotidyltransferase [Alphaproteobacteria bacterium]|nr:polyribonucleotide nucleotidyltransferase [Alphaproteobacteria bacterium]